jgi:DNA-binding transcriptional LysR family regulator
MKDPWMSRTIVIVLMVFVIVGLGVAIVPRWLWQATAPGQGVHSLVRLSLPNGDLAIVVLPADPARDGEVALWWVGSDAPQIQSLISVAGQRASR